MLLAKKPFALMSIYIVACYSVMMNARMRMDFQNAERRCNREGDGSLFVPDTEFEYQFARYMILKSIGFSGKILVKLFSK